GEEKPICEFFSGRGRGEGGGRPAFGWCCGGLGPGAGVPLRPDGVLLPLQQL
ncbi:unnamed protein product, partial [Bubo scandiacus]